MKLTRRETVTFSLYAPDNKHLADLYVDPKYADHVEDWMDTELKNFQPKDYLEARDMLLLAEKTAKKVVK